MLSDEEKEAIEWLKRLVKINKRDNLDNTFAEILLNLIENQSNEIEELKEDRNKFKKRDYISKKKLYKHIEMLEKENCHETCAVKKLINCERQCSIGCTIKNIKKILEE